jgi:hypothetical protein
VTTLSAAAILSRARGNSGAQHWGTRRGCKHGDCNLGGCHVLGLTRQTNKPLVQAAGGPGTLLVLPAVTAHNVSYIATGQSCIPRTHLSAKAATMRVTLGCVQPIPRNTQLQWLPRGVQKNHGQCRAEHVTAGMSAAPQDNYED